jgi:ribonuclease P protein component
MAFVRAWPRNRASAFFRAVAPRAAKRFPPEPDGNHDAVGLRSLKTRSQFQRVQAGGKWVAKAFVLQGLTRRDEPDDGPRFGFTVSSRALMATVEGQPRKRPGAVLRNRARRRLKEAVRLAAPDHARGDFDYVVIGRREALHQCFADLLEDMRIAFDKVHRPPRAKGPGTKPGPGRERAAGADQRNN